MDTPLKTESLTTEMLLVFPLCFNKIGHQPLAIRTCRQELWTITKWQGAKFLLLHSNKNYFWCIMLHMEEIYRPSMNKIEHHFHGETAVHNTGRWCLSRFALDCSGTNHQTHKLGIHETKGFEERVLCGVPPPFLTTNWFALSAVLQTAHDC